MDGPGCDGRTCACGRTVWNNNGGTEKHKRVKGTILTGKTAKRREDVIV